MRTTSLFTIGSELVEQEALLQCCKGRGFHVDQALELAPTNVGPHCGAANARPHWHEILSQLRYTTVELQTISYVV